MNPLVRSRALPAVALALVLALPGPAVHAQSPSAPPARGEAPAAPAPVSRAPRPQPRPHGERVAVDPALVSVDDGDTFEIVWAPADTERVRILGIDTPETAHPQHDLPYAQSFGAEARAFARGAFAAAERIELLRASTTDPYGRTLGYAFLNGRNYSVLVVRAGLAEESVTRYGDNGLADEAAEVLAAAKAAGPTRFESPADFRRRMRELSRWMKEKGIRPE
jgi:endonuclease YncB( thermonuclease family)